MSDPYFASLPRYAALRKRIDETLAKHPELEAYTWPASEGSVRDVIAKLDEIAELLRRLVGSAGR